ncbi:MAG TPA: GNAT family N-acetyltransferase [Candidatus Limnocylindrales bacterium]|nr:GNAT family N-acetyltransferase [Candidatus Limnocylindrales bacterium]
MTWTIRRADPHDEADLRAIVSIIAASAPEWPTSLDEMRWSDATYPGTVRLIAEMDGRPVGAATVGRIYVYPPDYDGLWGTVDVLPRARRRGIGSALLRAIAAVADSGGKGSLHVPATDARPDGIAFLERRGFAEIDRHRVLRLDLVGLEPPGITLPDGIVLSSLAARPDLVEGVHRVALESFRDIPGSQPMAAGDLAEFRARDVDRPGIPADAFVVAIEEASGVVIGYASLVFLPGSRCEAVHDMTVVRATWRGRGVATAMKQATIGWAIGHGLTALETGNDEANLAMRALNGTLGYQPLPDEVTMRGSVAKAMMER